MAAIPFLTAHVSYKDFVSFLLNTGNLNYETCASIQGGLVGLVFGDLYPIFLVIPYSQVSINQS